MNGIVCSYVPGRYSVQTGSCLLLCVTLETYGRTKDIVYRRPYETDKTIFHCNQSIVSSQRSCVKSGRQKPISRNTTGRRTQQPLFLQHHTAYKRQLLVSTTTSNSSYLVHLLRYTHIHSCATSQRLSLFYIYFIFIFFTSYRGPVCVVRIADRLQQIWIMRGR